MILSEMSITFPPGMFVVKRLGLGVECELSDGISRVAPLSRGLARRNQIGGDRRARQKPASERFGLTDRTLRQRGGGQRLALER